MSLLKSAEEFKKLANTFKAMIQLAEELEKIGNIEAEKEKANKQASINKQLLEDSNKSLSSANAQVSEALLKAEEIVKNANEKAASIISGAKAQSLNIQKEGNEKKNFLDEKIIQLNAEIADLREEIKKSKIEYEEIQNRLVEVKKKLTDFVGN